MPLHVAHACAHPGCPNLTHQRYCKSHEHEIGVRIDRQHRASTQFDYGRSWRKLSAAYLAANPFCTDPYGIHARAGQQVKAKHTDHKVPRKRGGTDDWSNLQGLCLSCHSRKTALSDGRWGKGGKNV